MLSDERRRRLLEAINQQGSLSIIQAEKRLGVSRMTVHRDLDVLEAQGHVRKVHGGAVALGEDHHRYDPRARSFRDRLSTRADAKRAIARALARLVQGARTLVLDASSTVFFLAEALAPGSEDVFVVAGGLPLFSEMQRRCPRTRVALVGGEALPRTGTLVGRLALASLEGLRFDWAVVSALGVLEEEGAVFDSNPEEVEVKRAFLARARRKALAVDSAKIGLSGAYKFADLSAFDAYVTEAGLRDIPRPAGPPRRPRSRSARRSRAGRR